MYNLGGATDTTFMPLETIEELAEEGHLDIDTEVVLDPDAPADVMEAALTDAMIRGL